MPVFCRHNRFEANCPICSREKAAAAPSAAPAPRARAARSSGTGTARRSSSMRTRQLARAAEDGYRSELVPGVKATADAERLARALAAAAARLEFPGPHPELVEEPELERATWRAFDLVAGDPAPERTAAAFRAWVERAGSAQAAFTGEPAWTPGRRFSRLFDRLALPGFGRPERFELLAVLGAAGLYPLEAERLHLGGEDETTVAAKRALVSGDVLLLERRAAALATAAGLPLAALDRGLAAWNGPGEVAGEPSPALLAALGLG